jgi:ceramide synthetase
MVAAFRFGFARVGASILILHDASDIPVDATRLCRALGWLPGLYASVAATLVSWAALRLYAFPRYLVSGAFFDTTFYIHFDYVGTTGLACIYLMYIVPLVSLTALHYYWFAFLLSKAIRQLGLRRKDD